MAYNAIDVSRYIINYCNKNNYYISNLKLQKLLYFVQAFFLVREKNGSPCFNEKIEAWDFGPVVPEVYHTFKIHGSLSIPEVKYVFDFNEDDIWNSESHEFDENVILPKDRQDINRVIDRFAPYSASTLVDITHAQRPWREAYSAKSNNEIKQESIRSYFSEKQQGNK